MLGAGALTSSLETKHAQVVLHALVHGTANKFVLDQQPSEQGESGKGDAAVPPHAYLRPLWVYGRPSQTFNTEVLASHARLFRGLVIHELFCAPLLP